MKDDMVAASEVERRDSDQLVSVLFDGNKETLDMAMNLMNEEVSWFMIANFFFF